MHAMPLLLGVLAVMAIAYRFYSSFLTTCVACVNPANPTPAERLNDGQNYHPTHRWILFGHHFAAISGAGPLIGPVIAVQFGYMPGLIWLVIGVCLAGAVQDFLVLTASVRHDGKSLAELAKHLLGPTTGVIASIAILFIVIIALSGLGVIVVKALGGESIKLVPGSTIAYQGNLIDKSPANSPANCVALKVPDGATISYSTGAFRRSESFTIEVPKATAWNETPGLLVVPANAIEKIQGSSWGTFTIFCTIPIALLVGLYMYRFRVGKIGEASLLGAIGVIGATIAGNWIPGSVLEPYFSLDRQGILIAGLDTVVSSRLHLQLLEDRHHHGVDHGCIDREPQDGSTGYQSFLRERWWAAVPRCDLSLCIYLHHVWCDLGFPFVGLVGYDTQDASKRR
jgi:carbon starvation protein